MKKDDNSGVSIKQIMLTTLFLTVVTLGGLGSYRMVCNETTNAICEIESANLDLNEESFEFVSALVENTEDDVIYSENIKYLAVNMVADREEAQLVLNENGTNFGEKVTSRGNYIRNQVASEIKNEISFEIEEEIKSELESKTENTIISEVAEDKTVEEPSEIVTEEKSEEIKEEEVEVKSEKDIETETVLETSTINLVPPTEYLKTIDVKATAYCLCKKCCGKSPSNPAYGITASGLKIEPGTGMKVVASDPKVIPLGTEVYIQGLYGAKDYGYAIVADTGSAIKNLKIDLYMDTHQMALNWGVKTVRVYILDK